MLIPDASKFETLVGFFSFASWVFYGLCFLVLVYLRFKRKDMERPYKVCSICFIFMTLVVIVFHFRIRKISVSWYASNMLIFQISSWLIRFVFLFSDPMVTCTMYLYDIKFGEVYIFDKYSVFGIILC